MNCTNCGNILNENAKFCQKCGTPVSVPNMSAGQQPVNATAPMQQPVYGTILSTNTHKKNNIIIIGLAIVIVVLALMLISMQSKVSSLKAQLEQYENRNSIEKSIDAIGSWID